MTAKLEAVQEEFNVVPDISIVGNAADGESDPYWVNLYVDHSRWEGGEPGVDGAVLSASSGKWVYKVAPDKGVYAMDTGGAVVVFFRNLVPADAKVGDRGNGNANGTGRTISWKVDSL